MNVLCVPSSAQSASKIIKAGKDSLVLYPELGTNPRLNVKMSVSENTC